MKCWSTAAVAGGNNVLSSIIGYARAGVGWCGRQHPTRASEALRRQENDYALVISHHRALAEYWRLGTGTDDLAFGTSIDDLQTGKATGLSVSSHNLHTSELGREILALGKDASFLVIVDEAHDAYPTLAEYVGHLLAASSRGHSSFLRRIKESRPESGVPTLMQNISSNQA
jgi:hypothetical protein